MIKFPLYFLETCFFDIEYVIISLMLKNLINRKGKVAIKLENLHLIFLLKELSRWIFLKHLINRKRKVAIKLENLHLIFLLKELSRWIFLKQFLTLFKTSPGFYLSYIHDQVPIGFS